LKSLGISNRNVVFNPSVAELYEYALKPEHMESPDPTVGETTITTTGALSCSSGSKMGRVPTEKRIVEDEMTKDDVHWGAVNIPMGADSFARNRQRAVDFLNMRPRIFITDGYAGWDDNYSKKVRVIVSRPYHALFMKQMLRRDSVANLRRDFAHTGPDFTILNAGEFVADPNQEDMSSTTSVCVNFTTKEQIILGTSYAGEMKKGIFGVMHYYMPKMGVLSMHSSANIGPEGDTTVLFGLSGTGKTTLSSDPKRNLIGDDEHVWTNEGVFNIEGGCYAKCDGLSRDKEPDIFDAVKFGALVENIEYFPEQDRCRVIDYDNISKTPNTRVCYPLEHIKNV
jgi:phosphoenolpyruvate carboxykinase (ATP)